MYQTYLITGATGFLGRAVLQLLLAHSCRVLALVMDKDPLAYMIPENVTVFCGDLTDKDTLRSFFAAGGDNFCVLHCAGIVSVASKPDEAVYRVNVQGTQNIIDLCWEFGAGRLIYVSSVHALPEKPAPETITETGFGLCRTTFLAIMERAKPWRACWCWRRRRMSERQRGPALRSYRTR